MHYCVHCGRASHRRGHLTRHYVRHHPFATAVAWLILGLPALAAVVIIGVVYGVGRAFSLIVTGGKTGGPRVRRPY